MDFIKNFLALLVSTAVWASCMLAVLSLYYIVLEQDVFYVVTFLVSSAVIGAGVLLAKYNVRVRAALEIPMGFLGL